MKKIALAFAFAATATTAVAGALSDPIVEPQVIIEESAASSVSQQWLVPGMFLLILIMSS
ncbi:MAG TPA: hypothetical protein ENJ52_03240 [Aliiroseovarius sp.]|nr:hypothetical protein [Aliiroseovarius sp.]